MQYKRFECVECDGVFKIKHEQEPSLYKVLYCSFCGTELIDEQHEDIVDDDDLYEEDMS